MKNNFIGGSGKPVTINTKNVGPMIKNLKKKLTKNTDTFGFGVRNYFEAQYDKVLKKVIVADLVIDRHKCHMCGLQGKHTRACLKKQKRNAHLSMLRIRREKYRRSKKITMTVGELEDKIRDAQSDCGCC